VGVASVDRFDGAPKGHHPRDFLPTAKSVIAFGVALLHQAVYWDDHLADSEFVPPLTRNIVLEDFFYRETAYAMPNNLLDMLALRGANILESRGHRSIFIPATYETEEIWNFVRKWIPSKAGLFSLRHAAVRAGLGEFGMNNLVVTREHGPRIRFNSVITEAGLIPTPLLTEKVCLGEKCSLCLEKCQGTITLYPDVDPSAVWYSPPVRTDTDSCLHTMGRRICLRRCLKGCPVAQKRTKSTN
jgi:epoxyqueuosine reductase QueG